MVAIAAARRGRKAAAAARVIAAAKAAGAGAAIIAMMTVMTVRRGKVRSIPLPVTVRLTADISQRPSLHAHREDVTKAILQSLIVPRARRGRADVAVHSIYHHPTASSKSVAAASTAAQCHAARVSQIAMIACQYSDRRKIRVQLNRHQSRIRTNYRQRNEENTDRAAVTTRHVGIAQRHIHVQKVQLSDFPTIYPLILMMIKRSDRLHNEKIK